MFNKFVFSGSKTPLFTAFFSYCMFYNKKTITFPPFVKQLQSMKMICPENVDFFFQRFQGNIVF